MYSSRVKGLKNVLIFTLPNLFVCSIVNWHTARFRATGNKFFLELWKYFSILRSSIPERTSCSCPSDKSGVNVKMSTKHWYHTDRGNWSTGRETCPPSANLSRKAWPGIEPGTRSEKLLCCHTATARPSSKVRPDTRQKLGEEKQQSDGKWQAAVCRIGRNGCEACQVSGQPISAQNVHPNTAVQTKKKIQSIPF